MNKQSEIERIQEFLDKSSYHKWKEIQEAIDFLKTYDDHYKMWEEGYKAGIKDRTNFYKAMDEEVKARLSNTYANVEWRNNYAQAAGDFYTVFLPRLTQLGREVGVDNVRIVFGFDS